MNLNPMDLLKDLKKMQSKMTDMQDKLKDIIVFGSAGGDMVTIKMNCDFKVLEVKIAKEAINTDDIEMLQDLILAAITNAISKVKEKIQEYTTSMTGNLNIPTDFLGL